MHNATTRSTPPPKRAVNTHDTDPQPEKTPTDAPTMIQFPPEMDKNWVRYGLAKLGQISKLPNWQKIVVLCVHNTTSALNS